MKAIKERIDFWCNDIFKDDKMRPRAIVLTLCIGILIGAFIGLSL